MAGVKKRNVLVLLLSCVGWPPGLAAMEFAAPVGLYVNRDGLIQLRADQRVVDDLGLTDDNLADFIASALEKFQKLAGLRGSVFQLFFHM